MAMNVLANMDCSGNFLCQSKNKDQNQRQDCDQVFVLYNQRRDRRSEKTRFAISRGIRSHVIVCQDSASHSSGARGSVGLETKV
jgi:hypothetical protein